MFLVQNERAKLTANWLNTLATATIAAGVFAPLAAVIYGVSQPPAFRIPLAAMAAACFVFGTFLHVLGRLVLGRLQE